MTAVPGCQLRAVALALTAAAALALLSGLDGPGRVAVIMAWALLAPGLAVVRLMSLDSAVAQVAVAVGLSVAALILSAEAMLYLEVSGAHWTYAVIAVMTLFGAALPVPDLADEAPPRIYTP